MKQVEELELPELTTKQTSTLCSTAEGEARRHILSRTSAKQLETPNVSLEAEGSKPLNFSVEIDLQLTVQAKHLDVKNLADEAAKKALEAAESYLRHLI